MPAALHTSSNATVRAGMLSISMLCGKAYGRQSEQDHASLLHCTTLEGMHSSSTTAVPEHLVSGRDRSYIADTYRGPQGTLLCSTAQCVRGAPLLVGIIPTG